MADAWYLADDELERELARQAPAPAAPVVPGYAEARELARGGQGIVYAAVQTATRRLVALKVLRELPDAAQRRRFQRELDLAAVLEHANVVTVFDAGTCADGRPFLAMELVDGPTIEQAPAVLAAVSGNRADLDRVVALVAAVADGVACAHRHGVVHRDLKPSNIRLTADGVPKVLDFGLARALQGGDADVTVAPGSPTHVLLGSLPWCSPEQARGERDRVDMRADVWALGMLLYHLLTGRFPFAVDGGIEAVLANIVHAEAVPLRQRVPAATRDLQTVVACCLAKDADRRYPHAGALAADLRACLAGTAIAARADGSWHLVRRLVHRHRLPVALAAALLLALVAGLLASWSLWRQARAGEQVATAAARRANAAMEFFADSLAAALPERQGQDVRVLDLLRQTDRGLPDRFGNDDDSRLFFLFRLTDLYCRLSALPDAERVAADAVALATRSLGEHAPLTLFARANRGRVWHLQGRYREVVDDLADAAAIATTIGLDASTVHVCNNLGLAQLRLGQTEAATAAFARVLSVPAVDDTVQQLRTAAQENLASIAWQRGDAATATTMLREVVAARTGSLGAENPATLDSIGNLAFYLAQSDQVAAAESLTARALAIARRRCGDRALTTLNLLSNHAQYLQRLGRAPDAITEARECLQARSEVLGPEHPHTLVTRSNLATMLLDVGDAAAAVTELAAVLAVRERIPTTPAIDLLGTRNNLARARHAAGDPAAAIAAMTAVVADSERQLGPDHRLTRAFRARLGIWLADAGEAAAAASHLDQALRQTAAALGRDHADTTALRDRLRRVLRQLGRDAEAAALDHPDAPPR